MNSIPTASAGAILEPLEGRLLLSVSAMPASQGTALTSHSLAAPHKQTARAHKLLSVVRAAMKRAGGADPIFMKYGDIKGEVAVNGFAGDIQLNSFQWGVGRGISGNGAGREASAPSISEITITKPLDSTSIALTQEAFIGDPTAVEIDFAQPVKGSLQTYYKITLSDAMISGYSMSSGGDRPTESLSLNFTKITFTSIDRKGQTQTFAYDPAGPGVTAGLQQALSLTSAVKSSTKSASATDPIYMKYGDIKGEVAVNGFAGDIQLNSFQWGVGRGISGNGAGREASVPSVSEIVVTKVLDSTSVALTQEALIGEPTSAEIDFAKPVRGVMQTYYKITLSDALISGYSMNSGGDRPTESLSLNFTKITFVSTPRSGQVQTFTYDLAQGVVV
jgi:type VI secretion system secreted protein Hcp